jgi:hypothetical protein
MNVPTRSDAWAAGPSSRYYGDYLKFNEGRWQNATDPAGAVPTGKTLIVTGVSAEWIRWQGQAVAERQPASLPREELGHDDQSTWPPGLNGQPRDPWQFVRRVELTDPKTLAEYRFETTTDGGTSCVGELVSKVNKARQLIDPDALPEVTLGSKPMKTKHGRRQRPHLDIVGWRSGGKKSAPALSAPPSSSSPPSSARNDMDDDIPF